MAAEPFLSLTHFELALSPVLSRKEETRAKAVSNSILLAPVGKVRLFFDDPSLDSAKKLTKTCRILEEKMKVSRFLD